MSAILGSPSIGTSWRWYLSWSWGQSECGVVLVLSWIFSVWRARVAVVCDDKGLMLGQCLTASQYHIQQFNIPGYRSCSCPHSAIESKKILWLLDMWKSLPGQKKLNWKNNLFIEQCSFEKDTTSRLLWYVWIRIQYKWYKNIDNFSAAFTANNHQRSWKPDFIVRYLAPICLVKISVLTSEAWSIDETLLIKMWPQSILVIWSKFGAESWLDILHF